MKFKITETTVYMVALKKWKSLAPEDNIPEWCEARDMYLLTTFSKVCSHTFIEQSLCGFPMPHAVIPCTNGQREAA